MYILTYITIYTIINNFYFQVILDEHANVIVEDKQLKRKRYQAKLLRRDTLIRRKVDLTTEELSESVSSEEKLTKKVCIK